MRPKLDTVTARAWVVRWTETEYDPPGYRYLATSSEGVTYATSSLRYATRFATKKSAQTARREYVAVRRQSWPYRDVVLLEKRA